MLFFFKSHDDGGGYDLLVTSNKLVKVEERGLLLLQVLTCCAS